VSFALVIPRGQGADTVRIKAPSNKERVEWIRALSKAKTDAADARRAAALGDRDRERAQRPQTRPSHARTSSRASALSIPGDAYAGGGLYNDARPSPSRTSRYSGDNYNTSRDGYDGATSYSNGYGARPASGHEGSLSPPVPRRPERLASPQAPPPLPRRPSRPEAHGEGQEVYDYSGHKSSMYDHEF
jgi:hypothetical protein